jgi:arginyl-tRNA synthetase
VRQKLSLVVFRTRGSMRGYKFPEKLQEAAGDWALVTIAQYIFELTKTYNRIYGYVSIFHAKSRALALRHTEIVSLRHRACVVRFSMQLSGIKASMKV